MPEPPVLEVNVPIPYCDVPIQLTPEFPVVVAGDSGTQYQKIMDVLDLLGRLGISQVGLATKARGK